MKCFYNIKFSNFTRLQHIEQLYGYFKGMSKTKVLGGGALTHGL